MSRNPFSVLEFSHAVLDFPDDNAAPIGCCQVCNPRISFHIHDHAAVVVNKDASVFASISGIRSDTLSILLEDFLLRCVKEVGPCGLAYRVGKKVPENLPMSAEIATASTVMSVRNEAAAILPVFLI